MVLLTSLDYEGRKGLLEQKGLPRGGNGAETSHVQCKSCDCSSRRTAEWKTDFFLGVWQPGGLLTLSRKPALHPKAVEAELLFGCLLHLPWQCWFFGQLTRYPLAAWNTYCWSHPIPKGSHCLLSSPCLTFFLPPFSYCICAPIDTFAPPHCLLGGRQLKRVLVGCTQAVEWGWANAASTTTRLPGITGARNQ